MALRLQRWLPLTGILAVALWVIGLLITESTDMPADDASADQVLAWVQDNADTITIGSFLFMIGVFFFFWFLGALRERLFLAEGGSAALTATTFAGGVAMAVFALGFLGGDLAAGISEDSLNATTADALHNLGDLFFVGAEISAAVLLAGTGLVALQTRVLPKWLAWVSLLIALVLLIGPIGWAALIFAVPLWIIVLSILMWMRPVTTAVPAATPTVATPTV